MEQFTKEYLKTERLHITTKEKDKAENSKQVQYNI